MKTITQRQLRNNSTAVLREVQGGQVLIVTRNGVPIAELRPIQRQRFAPRATTIEEEPLINHVDVEPVQYGFGYSASSV